MIIAVDGPAGAGKSTIAKSIAQKLGFLYIDTGALYRALTLKVLEEKTDLKDIDAIINIARNTGIDLINNPDGTQTVLLDGRDVSLAIREPRITRHVSDIAKIKQVSEVMLGLQRDVGRRGNSLLRNVAADEIAKLLKLSETERLLNSITIAYPKEIYPRRPLKKITKVFNS